jgi:hypothetical protein
MSNTLHDRHGEAVSRRAGCQRRQPDLPDWINCSRARQEVRRGIWQHSPPIGAALDVRTQHHVYRIVNREDGRVLITGPPELCPKPVLVPLNPNSEVER